MSEQKGKKELRRFGFALGAALALVGGLLLWRGRGAGPYLLSASVLILLTATLFPDLLRPLERLLERLARVVTGALTYVVLTLSFFLVVTPIGLLARLFRRDLLGMKPARDQTSFWVSVKSDSPATRPDKPY